MNDENKTANEIAAEGKLQEGIGLRRIGTTVLWAIPLLLACAASVWLGTYIEAHNFRHQLSQEDRAAANVGALERPKSKFKLEAVTKDCLHVTGADIDGTQLRIYGKNECDYSIRDYMEWHWEMLSPDRTIIHSGYTNLGGDCPYILQPGDKAECKF